MPRFEAKPWNSGTPVVSFATLPSGDIGFEVEVRDGTFQWSMTREEALKLAEAIQEESR